MYRIMLVSSPEDQVIYDQSQMSTYSVVGPKYEFEINEAGSLTFSLVIGHPLYDTLEPLASFVRAYDDNEEIFYGRIIQRSEPTLEGQVSFICEGALSFLMDSEIAPFGKDNKGNPITQTMTAQEFLQMCITQHNAEVQDSRRQFTIGSITASKRARTDEYSITNYTQTKSAIESNILNMYGGFIRVRPNNNGGYAIDWLENYEVVNPQPITIGTNVEEQTNEMDGSSMFTVIRPVGNDGLVLPEGTIDVYSAADIAKYGRIVKTIDFKAAENVDQLRSLANVYKSEAHKTLFNTSSIQLVDMHYVDGNYYQYQKIRGGDRFTHIYGYEGVELVAASLELDFENPQNDSVTLKNRKSMEPDGTNGGGRGRMKSSGGRGGGGGGGGGAFLKYILEAEDYLEVIANEVYMHGQTLTQHYEQILQNADYYESISSRVTSAEDYIDEHTEKFNDVEYNIREIQGTGVIQNSQFISALSGHFEIWTDSTTGKPIVHLKNGAEISVDDATGGTITVGERLEQYGADIAGNKAVVDSLQGSALWTQRDQIVGVAGEYDIQYIEVEDPPGSGTYVTKKVLVVKSGGGMKIREDNVEYGVYHDGNLTGGLMVQKINEDQSHTVISGDKIDLTAVNGRINLISSELMSTVQSTLDDFYTQIIQEASQVVIRTGENTKTYKSDTQPQGTLEDPLVDGDLWFQSEGTYTWGEAGGKTWLEDAGHVWADALTSKVHRYNALTRAWEQVIDERAALQDTRFQMTDEAVTTMAGRVDIIDKEVHVHYSELKTTADGLNYKVNDYYNKLSSHIEVTANSLTTSFNDRANGLSSMITQTASQIRLEVNDSVNGLSSNITQTASQIRAEVNDSVNNLSGRITVEANKVAMVVDGNGIKSAQIVAAINNGSSSVLISADHINLDGYVKATDLTTSYFSSKISSIGNVTMQNATVNGGLTSFGRVTGSTVGANTFELGGASFTNLIKSASVSNNTLTLTPLKGDPITFNKATAVTLSGAWSSGVFTVTAAPDGQTFKTSLASDQDNVTVNGANIYIPVKCTMSGATSYYSSTGYRAYCNWQNVLPSHSGCTGGLHRYNTGSKTTMYIKMGDIYSSCGSHYWYYKDTNSYLTTYYG